MKLNLKINSMLLCLALFAACSSDDDGQVAQDSSQEQKQPQKTYSLSIQVAENPMVQEGEGGSSRRAAITNTSSLSTFYMDYAYNSTGSDGRTPEVASKTAEGKWNGGTWPSAAADDNYNVSWYAYSKFVDKDHPVFISNGSNPYLSFTVEELASKHHDLLVATASGTYAGTGGNLSFTFNHACSALRFLVKKSSNLGTSTLTVTSIKLYNVKNSGQYYYSSSSWTLGGTTADYSLYKGDAKTISGDYEVLMSESPYLFLIPQTLTGWNGSSGTYVEVEWTSNYTGSSTSGIAKIPLSKTLLKGHQHDIKISIGTTTLTTYSAS